MDAKLIYVLEEMNYSYVFPTHIHPLSEHEE